MATVFTVCRQTCQGWERKMHENSGLEARRAKNGVLGEGAVNPSPPARVSGEAL